MNVKEELFLRFHHSRFLTFYLVAANILPCAYTAHKLGYRIMVVQRVLVPYVWVRLLLPQPYGPVV